jgi:hypothetical protein
VRGVNAACGPRTFEVRTFRLPTAAPVIAAEADDVSFVLIVP